MTDPVLKEKKEIIEEIMRKLKNQAALENKQFDVSDYFFKLAFMNTEQLKLIKNLIGA